MRCSVCYREYKHGFRDLYKIENSDSIYRGYSVCTSHFNDMLEREEVDREKKYGVYTLTWSARTVPMTTGYII